VIVPIRPSHAVIPKASPELLLQGESGGLAAIAPSVLSYQVEPSALASQPPGIQEAGPVKYVKRDLVCRIGQRDIALLADRPVNRCGGARGNLLARGRGRQD